MQCSFLKLFEHQFFISKNWCIPRKCSCSFFPFLTVSGRCRDAFVRLETGLDDFVSLECGDHDIEDPEEDEDGRGNGLDVLGSSQFTSNGRTTAKEQDENGDQGFNAEHGDGESQAANRHNEF